MLNISSPRMPRHIRDFSSPSRAKIQKLIIQSTRNNKESRPKWSTQEKNTNKLKMDFSYLKKNSLPDEGMQR